VRWASFVKLPHTVFALPFALVGVTVRHARGADHRAGRLGGGGVHLRALGGDGVQPHRGPRVDARNPRTAQREIPRGAIGVREAWVAVAVAAALFVWAAWQLNPLCLALSPVALGWVLLLLVHQALHALRAPRARARARDRAGGGLPRGDRAWSEPWWMLIVLSLAVMTWSGGFDILYALQDIEFDRSQGLHSIPAALGCRGRSRWRACCT
jgi:4-hydroxybenzoate polyprenyltransferase